MEICKHRNKLVAETSHLPLAFHIPHCLVSAQHQKLDE